MPSTSQSDGPKCQPICRFKSRANQHTGRRLSESASGGQANHVSKLSSVQNGRLSEGLTSQQGGRVAGFIGRGKLTSSHGKEEEQVK